MKICTFLDSFPTPGYWKQIAISTAIEQKSKRFFNKIPSVKKESILHQWKQSILMDRRVRFFPLLLDSHMEVSTIKQNVFRTGITEIQIIIITDIAKLGLNHICRLSGSIFSWKLTGLATTAHYFAIFIRPESDHWLCLSVTHSLSDCC